MGLKYILFILSIIVLFFVFYKQYVFGKQWKDNQIEKMTELNETCNADSCEDYSTADFKNLPLREYCIKSSFNSTYDGNSGNVTSKEVLLQRIKEGYRFIDLNVFSASGDVYVGFDVNNSPTLISGNLKFYDALKTISETAFSNTASDFADTKMSNIGSYPVFVHIRVYRPPGSDIDIISNVANIITGKLSGSTPSPPPFKINYLLNSDGTPKQINSCTKLSDIMGKMIFSMDILNILEIYAPANDQNASVLRQQPDTYNITLPNMQKFVNVLTGGSTITAFYEYTDDTIINRTIQLRLIDSALNNSLQTNVKYMYISFPHPNDIPQMNSTNQKATGVIQPDINRFILNRSIQIAPLRVYLGDDSDRNLQKYNNIFETIGHPFAPMFHVYNILKPNQTNTKTLP